MGGGVGMELTGLGREVEDRGGEVSAKYVLGVEGGKVGGACSCSSVIVNDGAG